MIPVLLLTPKIVSNVWNSAYFPISGRISFDNTGSPYIAQRIITNSIFDPVKYAAYSPVFMPISLALTIGSAFAIIPAALMHTFCRFYVFYVLINIYYKILVWYRKDVIHRFQKGLKDQHDIHSCLMQYYPEVPIWWYGTIGVISFAFLCTAIKIIPTQLPIWAVVIAILLSFIFSVPLSMLKAITNQQVITPVIYEFIAGYILPGRPIANSIFKTVAYMTSCQSGSFAGNLKFGHYMKVPPQTMFTIQLVATIITCVWVPFIQNWMLNNIKDVCTPRQRQGFICPGSTTFATASVIFGAASPHLFSPGAP
jgi:OPT family oligopeptide transporter